MNARCDTRDNPCSSLTIRRRELEVCALCGADAHWPCHALFDPGRELTWRHLQPASCTPLDFDAAAVWRGIVRSAEAS